MGNDDGTKTCGAGHGCHRSGQPRFFFSSFKGLEKKKKKNQSSSSSLLLLFGKESLDLVAANNTIAVNSFYHFATEVVVEHI